MRVLSQGQIDLFDLAFARLIQMELPRFRRVFYEQGASRVALACRAAGIDKSVFATVFNLSRQAHNDGHSLNRTDMEEADAVFARFTRVSALDELRTASAQ